VVDAIASVQYVIPPDEAQLNEPLKEGLSTGNEQVRKSSPAEGDSPRKAGLPAPTESNSTGQIVGLGTAVQQQTPWRRYCLVIAVALPLVLAGAVLLAREKRRRRERQLT
jgi:hypothetical protein